MPNNIKNNQIPLRLLSSGQSVSNPIAIVAISSLVISILSIVIQIANYGATSNLARKEAPSLVQLADGNTVNVRALDPKERSPEVIKKFVSDSLIKMFNWDGLIQLSKDGEVITRTYATGTDGGRGVPCHAAIQIKPSTYEYLGVLVAELNN